MVTAPETATVLTRAGFIVAGGVDWCRDVSCLQAAPSALTVSDPEPARP